MIRYDQHFRALPRHIQQIPRQKTGAARGALFEHRANGFGPEDDETIVRQFDLSGMSEFWEIELSEPMACVDFARTLASHFFKIEDRAGLTDEDRFKLGPAAERVVDSVKVGIRQTLRAARSYGEPWFMEIPEPPPSTKLSPKAWMGFVPSDTVIIPPDPPVDGIDLNKLRVRPREAALWMLGNAMRRHLVPPSLAAAIAPKSTAQPEPVVSTPVFSGGPGRPTSMHLVEEEMERRATEGKTASTMAAEALALESWLAIAHPKMPSLGKKRIQNKLGPKFRRIPK